jgi:hypothetical protein
MRNQHSFKVGPGDKPGTTKVELDGEDISHLTAGVTVTYEPASFPRVELDVCVFTATSGEGLAEIRLPKGTRDLLVKFGWTPPTDADDDASNQA